MKRKILSAPLEGGWYSAYRIEGLNGVVYSSRPAYGGGIGWYFKNPTNGAGGEVRSRKAAIAALTQVQ